MTAFAVSGLGTSVPELIGEPYEDADGVEHLPMFRQPVLVFEATKEVLAAAHRTALSRSLPIVVFTSDLFRTGHDQDDRAAVRAVGIERLDLVGRPCTGRATRWTRSSGARARTPDRRSVHRGNRGTTPGRSGSTAPGRPTRS
ncbi:hypothetical protein HNR68_002050 [Saccharopolyspora hordei]|uniref:Uncharacterized protein n=1 Tax=Saccharopolyspora hordei TaxID=1838 RepID=A0A853AQV3_9PSEU|nr:hypothetical protein [Saccharopolyspora hordei]